MPNRTRIRWLLSLFTVGLLASAWAWAGTALSAVHGPRAIVVRPGQQLCRAPYPARRDRSNPLVLPHAPGANPLNGARFFVNGPAHGAAAETIARMLGVNPASYPESYSWKRFRHDLAHGRLHRELVHNRGLAYEVHLLEKIASQPETQRISRYSEGGGPGAIYDETQKILCGTLRADRGSIPVINTYFLNQAGYCESASEILAHRPTFERQVSEMAAAIGRRPAVMLLEMDAIGSSGCMARTGALRYWEANIRYEIDKVAALPHTVVYIEGGYSDAMSAAYTARVLRAVGVKRIRGFYTNDTHLNWTIKEIRWAEKVSRLVGGTHFIVNTADNGRGPLLNPDPVHQGVEDLCNPPDRGAGPRPTTHTGFKNVDAFLWIHVPGESSGPCNGGTASGTFWLHRTLVEASHANGRLGPRYPSRPY